MPPKGTSFEVVQLSADGTTYTTKRTGKAILAYGADTLRISGYLRNVRDNFAIKPRYRKCPVRPESPEVAAWNDGTAVVSQTEFSEDLSLASLGSFMWIQPAIAGAVTSGAGGDGLVGWQSFTKGNGALVARQTVLLSPTINATKTGYVPLGNSFPALGLQGVMVAVAARGCSASPQINFSTRTFEGDRSMPSAWGANLLGTNKTLSSTNEDYNTGDLVYAPTDVGFAQIGLVLPAVDAYGTLDIIVAARYS